MSKKMMRVSGVLIAALSLSACVTAQVMPLGPNVVRIDTMARGMFAQGKAVPETMTRAARETLARGYTHFRLSDPSLGQNGGFGGNGSSNNGMAEGAGVTVTMFHDGEPGAKNAFDAKQVLTQYPEAQ